MGSDRRFSGGVRALCLCWLAGVALSAGRQRRELRFPKGGSFVAAVALASLLPKGPTDGFAHVLEFDLGFPFPEKLAIGKTQPEMTAMHRKGGKAPKPRPKKPRRQRNLKDSQRQILVGQMEDVLSRMGFNGSSCVSRLHCELHNLPSRNSLLEELLFALFGAPRQHDLQCHRFHRDCPLSLLHLLMHSEPIPPTALPPPPLTKDQTLQPPKHQSHPQTPN